MCVLVEIVCQCEYHTLVVSAIMFQLSGLELTDYYTASVSSRRIDRLTMQSYN